MEAGFKQSRAMQLVLGACCVVGAVVYGWLVLRVYRAQLLADHLDQSSVTRAIALAPANATYHNLLCRSLLFASQNPQEAVTECHKAAELNPYTSAHWLDLAAAYYSVGNKELTNVAIHKALAVDPTTPDTAWNAANFFLIQGNTSEALTQFAIVLREDPSLASAALNVCWQSLHDITRIQAILPPDPTIYLAFIKLLLSTNELTDARRIWSGLMGLNIGLDYHAGLFYVDRLLQAHLAEQAFDAWKELSSRSTVLQAYSQPNNLIMDGSFTHEILNSGFDWRYNPIPQIAVTLDRSEYHSDSRSLRIVYNATGSDAGISQYIAVQPNKRYRLSAWVKSDDLKTANGPSLTILNSDDNNVCSSTEETVGTTPWHRVEADLQTGLTTKLLILTVLRRPGDTRIQGTFWVDDVKLEPL
jgi:tetratricopeptide (TPR) repeat protein